MLAMCRAGSLARKRYARLRQVAAAVCIQKNVRMWLARKKFIEVKDAAVKIQAGFRGMAARKECRCRRQSKAATLIQVCILSASRIVYIFYFQYYSWLGIMQWLRMLISKRLSA